MGNKAVKQHFETAEKTGVLKISVRTIRISIKWHFLQFSHKNFPAKTIERVSTAIKRISKCAKNVGLKRESLCHNAK